MVSPKPLLREWQSGIKQLGNVLLSQRLNCNWHLRSRKALQIFLWFELVSGKAPPAMSSIAQWHMPALAWLEGQQQL